jgi:hypothetical protein
MNIITLFLACKNPRITINYYFSKASNYDNNIFLSHSNYEVFTTINHYIIIIDARRKNACKNKSYRLFIHILIILVLS